MKGAVMKYKVIIADDEPKVIQLIKQLGHFDELNIEIVDECLNGYAAYQSILKHKPDFVLSDIKMPVYDGIELIRKVREAKQDPLFVLLSGYRHFEYARSAISLNVIDYLLKPIDEELLNETLKKVCMRIDQQRLENEEKKIISDLVTSRNRQAMERFWRKVVYKDKDVDNSYFASEKICNRTFNTEFIKGCYQVLCIYSNLGAILGKYDTVSSNKVDYYIRESFSKYATVYSYNTYMNYILVLNFKEENKNAIREAIPALYYKIRDLREIFGEIRLSIGCSSVKNSVSDLMNAYTEAHSAEWGRLVLSRNDVLEYDQVKRLPRFFREDLVKEEEMNELKDCIKYLRKEELSYVFETIYKRAGELNYSNPEDMIDGFAFIRSGFLQCINDEEIRKRLDEDSYYAYLNARNFQKLIENLYIAFKNYIEEELNKLKQKKGKPIIMAAQYIKEHFSSPISLEEVAEAVNVSSTYLCKLFKNELGIGFNEFLTQIRLEESEKLLATTNLPIREIAARIGYTDEKYYSKLFKKVTGIKPTDYRKIYS